MDEPRYQIVFTGKLVAGHTPRQVLSALAELFKKTPQEIKASFKGGAVIIRNIPHGKVERALQALHTAGAVCTAQAMTNQAGETKPAVAPQPPATPETTIAAKPASITMSGAIRVLRTEGGSTSIALAPINCNRLSAQDNGLLTSRMDRAFIPFDQIVMAAVFARAENAPDYQLLLYSIGHKRPLLIAASQITFSDFPGVSGGNLRQSLRNFITFLAGQSPDFCIDEATEAFRKDNRQPVFANDPLLLASSLYHAYSSISQNLTKPAPPNLAPAKAKPVAPQTPQPDFPMENVRALSTLDVLGYWANRWQWPMLICALLGFALPLIKHSLLFDSYVLIWPWHAFGAVLDDVTIAAMATDANGDWYWLFSLLPLIVLVGVVAAYRLVPRRFMWLPLVLTGGLALVSSFLLFYREAALLGMIHLPQSWEGGAMILAVILAVITLAAVNHLYRQNQQTTWQRTTLGIAGTILLVAALLAMFAAPWNNWSLHLLYLALITLALIALKSAIKHHPDDISIELTSQLLRGVLIWTPIAGVLSQYSLDDPYVTYVIEGAMGLLPLIVNALKAYATYYAMALSLAVGITCMLTDLTQKRPSN